MQRPEDGDESARSPLEEDFPRGDGVADTEATVQCPYCWDLHEIAIDPGSGAIQHYEEDCPTCCRPWRVRVVFTDGTADVLVSAEDAP